MTYTYILQCADKTFYIGWTNNLENRFKTHSEGKGAKYTRGRRPLKLVYWEEHVDRSSAQKREMALRKLTRKEKEDLIEKNQDLKGLRSINL